MGYKSKAITQRLNVQQISAQQVGAQQISAQQISAQRLNVQQFKRTATMETMEATWNQSTCSSC